MKYNMDMTGTKWDIFQMAMDLYAKDGFYNVSMSQLAKAVGIRPSSIYNHFVSKDDLLQQIYRYYTYHNIMFLPKLDDLLGYSESHSIQEAHMQMIYFYPKELQSNMEKTFNIIASMNSSDPRANLLLQQQLLDVPNMYCTALLRHLITQGRLIEFDVEAFAAIFCCMCHSAALQTLSTTPVSNEMWLRSNTLLFGSLERRYLNKGGA